MKRVICGVNKAGENSILIDAPLTPFGAAAGQESTPNPGERIYLAWTSDPVHSTFDAVSLVEDLDLQLKPGETTFLRVEIGPGVRTTFHRTPHITDYLVALAGRLTMVAEDGTTSVLEPGDMLVQLGGWHYCRNDGDEPFVMAGVAVGVETNESVPGGVEFRSDTDLA